MPCRHSGAVSLPLWRSLEINFSKGGPISQQPLALLSLPTRSLSFSPQVHAQPPSTPKTGGRAQAFRLASYRLRVFHL